MLVEPEFTGTGVAKIGDLIKGEFGSTIVSGSALGAGKPEVESSVESEPEGFTRCGLRGTDGSNNRGSIVVGFGSPVKFGFSECGPAGSDVTGAAKIKDLVECESGSTTASGSGGGKPGVEGSVESELAGFIECEVRGTDGSDNGGPIVFEFVWGDKPDSRGPDGTAVTKIEGLAECKFE